MPRGTNILGWVYFIHAPSAGLIKIGWSGFDPRERLDKIRCTSPVPVEPMATTRGKLAEEKAFHRKFRDDWSHGEWFRSSPELLAVIADLEPWTPEARDRNTPVLSGMDPGGNPGGNPGRAVAARQSLADWAATTALTVRGVTKTIAEWSDLSGISPHAFKVRIRLGHDADRMIDDWTIPDTKFYGIKNKRSKEYREARDAYGRWVAAFTVEEWRRFTTWKRPAPMPDEIPAPCPPRPTIPYVPAEGDPYGVKKGMDQLRDTPPETWNALVAHMEPYGKPKRWPWEG
jgi:hypothetical protein